MASSTSSWDFEREDIGLGLSMVAAVALIGGFLVVTGESDDDDASTTAEPAVRIVRTESPQPAELAWSTARGVFAIGCEEGAPASVEARIGSLPRTLRYGWVAATANGALVPIEAIRGVTTEMVEGEGEPSAFRPVDRRGVVRSTFDEPRPRPADSFRLIVLARPSSSPT